MEEPMGKGAVFFYKFCSRGLFWLPLYGAIFGMNVIPLGYLWGALIGGVIGIALIFIPVINLLTPILYFLLLVIALIVGLIKGNIFNGILAAIVLVIHVFRTLSTFYYARKYPNQTKYLDAQYQGKL